MNSKYDYTIYPENSPSEFKKACKKIENTISGVKKKKMLIDVDGTTIQSYVVDRHEIDIIDDYEVCAVYARSTIDLGKLFC